MFCMDNLDVLRGINSNTVDLIYLDPPFAKNETFIATNKKKIEEVKNFFITRQKQYKLFSDVDFSEIFKDQTVGFKDIWSESDVHHSYYTEIDRYNSQLVSYFESIKKSTFRGSFYYLLYMAVRLIEMKRILKDTGSIYLHCDTTLSHYIKNMMDKIFGYENFKNEIIWWYGGGGASKKQWGKKHDTIFFYSKTNKWVFNTDEVREPYKWDKGQKRADGSDRDLEKGKIPDDVYKTNSLMPWAEETIGYPTQKPLKLLERIISASSNKGDLVLDPFCGCATTCVAAEKLQRRWIGIDKQKVAFYLVYYRVHELLGTEITPHLRAEDSTSSTGFKEPLRICTSAPTRTDISKEETANLEQHRSKRTEIKKKKRLSKSEYAIAKELLYEEQAGMCNGCDVYMRSADLTIDHITPRAEEGDDDLDNLQLLCYRCNNWKRTGNMIDLCKKLHEEQIISPGTYKKLLDKYSS